MSKFEAGSGALEVRGVLLICSLVSEMHRLDHAVRREVAESGLEFLVMHIVEYYLRGYGARSFVIPGEPLSSASSIPEVRSRLEAFGVEVGNRLVERYTMERDRLEADLDIVKFVCKDFWELTFKKQIDVLRTNHRGLYVLTDNNFKWLSRVSATDSGDRGTPEDYVLFPCGLIGGALSRLGLKCRVTAEIFPLSVGFKCCFHVQVIQG